MRSRPSGNLPRNWRGSLQSFWAAKVASYHIFNVARETREQTSVPIFAAPAAVVKF